MGMGLAEVASVDEGSKLGEGVSTVERREPVEGVPMVK
jgi:hypothetical protein